MRQLTGILHSEMSSSTVERVVASWLVLVACVGVARANYRDDGGFMPSSTYQRTEDQLAEPSARVDKSRETHEEIAREPERTQRFGISSYGTSGSGAQGPYGGSAPGLYGPVKIDLGGVLLGSILGFGAVLVLPKIIHALSYGYGGGYGRSAESNLLDVSDVLSKLDATLGRYNIDSAACTQRLACSYVQIAAESVAAGNATDFDSLLSSMSTNSLVHRMLDGTSILEAVTAGKSPETNCQQQYPKCKLDRKTVVKILTQMVPS